MAAGNGPRALGGVGTLVVFIVMVIVVVLAGGVLIEAAGLLQASGEQTGAASSSQVTDRVRIASATASYSDGSMTAIEIDLAKASGAGDIDLSTGVVHWLGPNGTTEFTDSSFSITPIRGSGTVLTDETDRMTVSNFGKIIPAGTPTTVRFVTADGGVTTAILRAPKAPPTDGAVSLLWRSPSGNPGHASTPTATQTPTPTPSPSLNQEWIYEDSTKEVHAVAAEPGTGLYIEWAKDPLYGDYVIQELDPADGSVVAESGQVTVQYFDVSAGDDPVWNDDADVNRWDTSADTVQTVFSASSSEVAAIEPQDGDFYLGVYYGGGVHKYDGDGTHLWTDSSGNSNAVDASSTAIYGGVDSTVKRYDHDGTEVWSSYISLSENEDIEVGPDSYIYAGMGNAEIYQLDKSDGSKDQLFTASSGQNSLDVETGPDGYVYVTDDSDLAVLDPVDGTTLLRKSFGGTVSDIEARSDGVYVRANDKLYKFTKSGF
jgi:hypothetical protein